MDREKQLQEKYSLLQEELNELLLAKENDSVEMNNYKAVNGSIGDIEME